MRAIKNLFLLLTDPWFSSLWTLQEAFLSDDAYLLSREAKLYSRIAIIEERPVRTWVCSLYNLLDQGARWEEACAQVTSRRTAIVDRNCQGFVRFIDQKGLRALYRCHETNVYVAA